MTNSIKNLKPRKGSKFHQGMCNPAKMKKYFTECKNEPIIYRSGLELQFIQYCENSSNILKWASEPIQIPYYNRLLKKDQHYYPDYIIETSTHQFYIVEIKPYSQTVKPKPTDNRWAKETWITNIDKWKAAKEYASARHMKFIIITEKFFESI